MEASLSVLREFCSQGAIRWTDHVLKRMMQRGISRANVVQAIQNGEIIESYPEDYPYPSCLLLGMTADGEPLHVVCGQGDSELWMITAYYPNPEEWQADLKSRKREP